MREAIRISADDGYALGATAWGAGGRGPVVVLNGATGVPQRYYGRFSAWLAEQGATVVTYDYRGIGESRPHRLRGFAGSMRDWGARDFEGVLRFARTSWSGRPLVAVGHSVGGQILGQAKSNVHLSRAVTVGSQFGSWHLWPGASRLALAGLWYGLMPGVTRVMGYFPGRLGIGEDLPREVALEWARWGRSRRFFLDHGVPAEGYARLAAPLLSFSFTDDTFAPRRAVDALHALFTGAQLERRHLSPKDVGARAIGHFGFFRDAFRLTLWQQLGAFVFAPAPQLPASSSHARGQSPTSA